MKNIKVGLWALVLSLSGLWLLADTLVPAQPLTYFAFRGVFLQFTGVIAMGAFSAAMILAMRPTWLEPWLNGLDKMYRLHKWLGITGLAFALTHWWWVQGTRWMTGWGWLIRPPRRQGGQRSFGLIEGWLRSQRELSVSLGEWAFYAAVVLIVLALVQRFPYHLFKKTHKWLAVAYFALVYHSVILSRFSYWAQPVGWLLALLMLGGTTAAVLVLLNRVGESRKTQGIIDSLIYDPDLRVLETSVHLQNGWEGHDDGQFAFVTSDKKEGPHPYTVASTWDASERRLVFMIKALGDHTSTLYQSLKVGDAVTVEGPYGYFNFKDGRKRQIWVGGGMGITSFIARTKHLAHTPGEQEIDLFHTTADFSQTAIDQLTADAKAAHIRLHVLVDSRDGLLDANQIRAVVPQWQSSTIWFSGPVAFGRCLRKHLLESGLASSDFHQELFEMR
jgi:predicted ferric reductase